MNSIEAWIVSLNERRGAAFLGLLLLLLIVCQWLLARNNRFGVGFILPALFLGMVFRRVYRALIIGTVTHRKDYFTAAALVFPAILLLCVYFSVYYRRKVKETDSTGTLHT
jgi:FtsH-binding integral membrane protein